MVKVITVFIHELSSLQCTYYCAIYMKVIAWRGGYCGSPVLGGVRMAGLWPLAGLPDYEDTRLKTLSRVRMGLSLAWKASLAIRYEDLLPL